jgi:hypothetical protein
MLIQPDLVAVHAPQAFGQQQLLATVNRLTAFPGAPRPIGGA